MFVVSVNRMSEPDPMPRVLVKPMGKDEGGMLEQLNHAQKMRATKENAIYWALPKCGFYDDL